VRTYDAGAMIKSLFISTGLPVLTETGSYEISLVILSYLVASFASYTALAMVQHLADVSDVLKKRIILWGGAFALGAGIWSMHFIGMLAYHMHMDVDYDIPLTLISLLIAIIVAYGVLMTAHCAQLSVKRIAVCAVLLGFGICAMHYIGMAAMRMDADLRYIPVLFLISVLIAIAASAAALWIAFSLVHSNSRFRHLLQVGAALVMGVAICGMHYTGMEAAVFIPHHEHTQAQSQNFNDLAFIISLVTNTILGLALAVTLYDKEKKSQTREDSYSFPAKLLSISLALTLLVVIWMGGNSYYIHYFNTHTVAKEHEVAEMADEILYLDSILTQSARTSATGDEKFDKRYIEAIEIDLDKKITSLPDKELQDAAKATDAANDLVVESDRRFLSLIKQGKTREADKILSNPEYARNSQIHMEGRRALSEKVRQISHENLTHIEKNIYVTLFLASAVIIVLLVAWYFVFRNIQKWRRELLAARQASADAQRRAEKEARVVTLLRSVAATANQAQDIESAIRMTLKLIGEFMEWPIGHAYRRDAERDVLICSGLWFLEVQDSFQTFQAITQSTVLELGAGLPGRVWKNLAPLWIVDLTGDPNFLRVRATPSSDIGLKSGFAFPVIVSGDVAYVLEFFTPQTTEANMDLQMIMKEAGDQLTQVIERVHTQEALKYAKVSAESANVAKSEFLANMSHELRTPLNSILGMLRLLRESGLDKEQEELAMTAGSASTNLLEIVNDILDLSKIEADEVELESIGFDVNYVFHSTVLTLERLAAEKRISITRNYKRETFPYVIGDPTRFGRILVNLISNAIKYTDEGRIEVNAFSTRIGENRLELHCEIKDTGIGIPKEKQGTIFEKFVQADASTTRKYGGTGLGLAITRQLVELMGGTIGVNSESGKGSTFWFMIPFTVTSELNHEERLRKHKAFVGIIPPGRARIMIAEDHPLNQLYIKKLLKKFGIPNFEIVENGALALKRFKEVTWDIILMDCHMPDMNGYDTTQAIRVMERGTGDHIPIVAMTANAMVGDREKCLRCGMDDYISKPVNIDELKEVLGQWIRFETPSADKNDKKRTEMDEGASPVNLTQLRTFTDGDADTEREFIGIFIQQSDKNIKILEESQANQAGEAWREAAHMFKGGAGGVGAEALRKLCDEAQHLDLEAAEERKVLFAKIKSEYEHVRKYLKNITG